jgi:hypothetical protein
MNRTEFWRGRGVVEELERELRQRLSASKGVRREEREGVDHVSSAKQTARRGFFSKLMPSLGPEKKAVSGNPEVGTRPIEEFGAVRVACRLEEICLRTVTDFGLYDTMTRQCVIVRVDAKC